MAGFVVLALSESSIQLVPDGTLVLHLALLVILVVVLNATLLKPINQILEERERLTTGELEKARRAFSQVDAELKRYEDALREARAQSYRRLEVERSTVMRERENRIRSLKGELRLLLDREKGAIARQAEEARATLALESGRIGLEISSHILGRKTSEIR